MSEEELMLTFVTYTRSHKHIDTQGYQWLRTKISAAIVWKQW